MGGECTYKNVILNNLKRMFNKVLMCKITRWFADVLLPINWVRAKSQLCRVLHVLHLITFFKKNWSYFWRSGFKEPFWIFNSYLICTGKINNRIYKIQTLAYICFQSFHSFISLKKCSSFRAKHRRGKGEGDAEGGGGGGGGGGGEEGGVVGRGSGEN